MTASQVGRDYIVSTLAPSRRHTQFAVTYLVALAAATGAAVHLGHVQLLRIDASVPAFAVAMLITDLLTAFLLFAQFSILRSRSLIAISSGYLFTGLITVPWTLSFPGMFSADGLLGAGLQTTGWLYLFWHAGFPSFGIAYALLKHQDAEKELWRGSVGAAIFWSVVVVAALVCGLTILVTAGQDLLPSLAISHLYFSRDWMLPLAFSSVLAAIAAVLLLRRSMSVLDLWLMVVMVSFMLQSFVGLGSLSRFSVSWYCERGLAFLSANLVLFVLLYETTTLYEQLLRAVLARRREHAARLLTGDALSASIAHEVRQPLAAMTTNANAGLRWLMREPPRLEEAKATFQLIVDDGHRAGAVIENIRAAFTSGAGARTLLDIGKLVSDSLALARAELEAHRISVDVEMADGLPRVKGDQVQLQQVLLNLITNAIDAMAALSDRERMIRISCRSQDPSDVMISVADSGTGVESENIDRIFDPLFTTKSAGMGMGLAICRSIVEAHAGTLRALSDKTQGAVFQIVLPAETA